MITVRVYDKQGLVEEHENVTYSNLGGTLRLYRGDELVAEYQPGSWNYLEIDLEDG